MKRKRESTAAPPLDGSRVPRAFGEADCSVMADPDGLFLRRVVIVVAVLVAFALAFAVFRLAGQGVLIVIAGIVIAVLIDGVLRRIPLPRRVALLLFLAVAAAVLGGLSWWLGVAFVEQLQGVQERTLAAWPRVEEWLNARAWGRRTLEEVAQFQWTVQAGGRFGELLFAALGGIATLMLVPVFAVFFALAPSLYIEACLHLLPTPRRPRVREVIGHIGHALRSWFVGRFVSMTVVGVGTGLGLWIAGVPMPVGLGLIAGLLSFVPNVGPILAAIPGALVGLSHSPAAALWAILVYVAVQAVDNYVVTPIVDQRAVDVPPAAQLGAQLVLGLAAGAIGVFLATPLIIVAIVAIQALYVQDALEDPVRLLGTSQPKRSRWSWLPARAG